MTLAIGLHIQKKKLKEMAIKFFHNLYCKEDENTTSFCPLKGLFPKIEPARLNNFEDEIKLEEIKDAFFSMGALKAPGLDGFHAIFFQSQWDTIGDSICNFIKSCFQDSTKINVINEMNVVLIPKMENP